MRETYIEREVCKWARDRGVPALKNDPTYFAGCPDRIFLVPGGRPIIIEFKKPGEEPERLQAYWMEQFRKLDYDVRWTDSKEEAIKWLEEKLNGSTNRTNRKTVSRRTAPKK